MHAANFKNHSKAAPYFDRLVQFFVCQSEFRNTKAPSNQVIGMKKCCKKIFTNLDLESDPNHILRAVSPKCQPTQFFFYKEA